MGTSVAATAPPLTVSNPSPQLTSPLSPLTDRPSIKCPHPGCGLNQFVTTSGVCRRCKQQLVPDADDPDPDPNPKPIKSNPLYPPVVCPVFDNIGHTLPYVIHWLRLRSGMSQRDLSKLLCVPRTYISKVENGNATPTLGSLARYADGLGVTVIVILRMCEILMNGMDDDRG